jgi:phage protein U
MIKTLIVNNRGEIIAASDDRNMMKKLLLQFGNGTQVFEVHSEDEKMYYGVRVIAEYDSAANELETTGKSRKIKFDITDERKQFYIELWKNQARKPSKIKRNDMRILKIYYEVKK